MRKEPCKKCKKHPIYCHCGLSEAMKKELKRLKENRDMLISIAPKGKVLYNEIKRLNEEINEITNTNRKN